MIIDFATNIHSLLSQIRRRSMGWLSLCRNVSSC